MILEAMLLLLPIFVALIYKENYTNINAFLKTIALILLIFGPFAYKHPKNTSVYAKEGLISVSLSWLFLSFFGALPFVFSRQIPSLVDAFFETASGLSTTGSSILISVESLTHSMLFWRSFTHFIGGMGVLVLALAIFPETDMGDIQLMKAEVPGPQFGKIMSKLKSTAQTLYIIYVVMTFVLTLVLIIAGMPVFDSILHAFGTAGTGGFGIKAASLKFYDSKLISNIISIGMILFGVNFNIYYFILIGKVKDAFKSEELRIYLSIILISTIMIFINIIPSYDSASTAITDSLFSVSSIMTTTGFSIADFNTWPLFSKIILILLMFIGGSAGSTAGGIKVSRIIILFKSAIAEIKRILSPNRCVVVRVDNRKLDARTEKSVTNYFLVYEVIFIILLFSISFFTDDFETAFTSVAATFNNIGPGLGAVGPNGNFAFFNPIAKVILSIGMIAGRLELYPMILLFSPKVWKK